MGLDKALVQNRLTILGFTLALLVFVTSSIISLAGAEKQINDFIWSYINSFLPISLGFLFGIAGIVSFLTAQQLISLWWFSVGQLCIYISLSQFLASGLNTFVFGLYKVLEQKSTHTALNVVLVYSIILLSEGLWCWLLFIAPYNYLKSQNEEMLPPKADRRSLWLVYLVSISTVFLITSLTYYIRHFHEGIGNFCLAFVLQVFQPFLWLCGV